MSEQPHVVAVLLDRRSNPGARSAMRRAASPATERYAYPVLAGLWSERTRPAVLALASLLGEYHRVPDDPQVKVGAALAGAVAAGQIREARAETILAVGQVQSLPAFLPTLRMILQAAQQRGAGISWTSLWWLVHDWDHEDLERRNRVRRALCESYFRAPSERTTEAPTEGDSTDA